MRLFAQRPLSIDNGGREPGMLNVLVFAAGLLVQAQPAVKPIQPVVISGRVVADDTGEPLPNVRITLGPAVPNAPLVHSDSDGRFEVPASGPAVRVVANKAGYAGAEARTRSGQPIEMRLRRAAAVSGRILDQSGDPLIGAQVDVERLLEDGSSAVAKSTQTDDNGEYRIGGLARGRVILAVRFTPASNSPVRAIGSDELIVDAPTRLFFPGVALPRDAQAIDLKDGDDRSVDMTVPAGSSGGMGARIMTSLTAWRENRVAPGSSALRGRVVTPGGQPIARASVTLMRKDAILPQRTATTDSEGRFGFAALPAGTFRLAAAKDGYAAAREDEIVVPGFPYLGSGPAVTLAEHDSRSFEITLVRHRAITGYVTDEHADPVEGALIQLLQVRYAAGRRSLVPADVDGRMTDDRGRYRVFSVPPGDYIVSASIGPLGSGDVAGYARTYFPGSSVPAEARFVALGAADDVSGIDFALERAATARVSGRILDAAGEPTMGGAVRLTPAVRANALRNVAVGARISRDGVFEFDNVAPGEYIVRADRGRSSSSVEGEFGALPITVAGKDVDGVVLRMSAGSSILGRFRFDTEPDAKLPPASAIELSPIGVDPDRTPDNVAVAEIHDDWTFEMHGINGRRRLALVRLPSNWALGEIRAKGNDVTDRILAFGTTDDSLNDVEVVLTDRLAEVSGTVEDARGRPAAGSHVIVAAMDRRKWYPGSRFLRRALAEQNGTFRVAGLPAGTYYLVGCEGVPAGGDDAWQDPEFLESIVTRGTTLTLQDGEKQSLQLEMAAR
jgi:protocatechuate 3,4-dioxygenase beta subunit